MMVVMASSPVNGRLTTRLLGSTLSGGRNELSSSPSMLIVMGYVVTSFRPNGRMRKVVERLAAYSAVPKTTASAESRWRSRSRPPRVLESSSTTRGMRVPPPSSSMFSIMSTVTPISLARSSTRSRGAATRANRSAHSSWNLGGLMEDLRSVSS